MEDAYGGVFGDSDWVRKIGALLRRLSAKTLAFDGSQFFKAKFEFGKS